MAEQLRTLAALGEDLDSISSTQTVVHQLTSSPLTPVPEDLTLPSDLNGY